MKTKAENTRLRCVWALFVGILLLSGCGPKSEGYRVFERMIAETQKKLQRCDLGNEDAQALRTCVTRVMEEHGEAWTENEDLFLKLSDDEQVEITSRAMDLAAQSSKILMRTVVFD